MSECRMCGGLVPGTSPRVCVCHSAAVSPIAADPALDALIDAVGRWVEKFEPMFDKSLRWELEQSLVDKWKAYKAARVMK